jgi:hypothetical protein
LISFSKDIKYFYILIKYSHALYINIKINYYFFFAKYKYPTWIEIRNKKKKFKILKRDKI